MKKITIKGLFPFISFIILFLLVCSFFVFFSVGKNKRTEDVFFWPRPAEPQMTVVIDAGHGGEDGGAIGINGCIEKELNLKFAMMLSEKLKEKGINCILTRTTDTLLYDRNTNYEGQKKKLDMQARKEIIDNTDNAILVSIHQNTFGIEKYSGFQAYYSAHNQESKRLSGILESNIKKELQPNNNRTSKPSDGIFLLDSVSCPAVLLECGFLTNKKECELLCNEKYQERLISVIADGIEKYINEF